MARPRKPDLRTLGEITAGTRVLELGNKKYNRNKKEPLYRTWYESIGVHYWCTDINGKDDAIVWDIRRDPPNSLIELGPFDVVTNFGFTEHVQTDEGQEACWRNIHKMVKPNGGQLSCTTPRPGLWRNHGKSGGFPGIYYPHPEFYVNFAKLNNYTVEDLFINPKGDLVCCRLQRCGNSDFTMPPATDMFINQGKNIGSPINSEGDNPWQD